MKSNAIIKIICYLSLVISLTTSCGPIKILCGDGNIVLVPRHPDKLCAQYVKTTDVNVKAAIDILEKIKINGLDVSTTGKVTQLRETLNQFSSRYQDILRTSFSTFCTKPCDSNIVKSHLSTIQNLGAENSALEKLRLSVENVVKKSNDVVTKGENSKENIESLNKAIDNYMSQNAQSLLIK